MTLIVGIKCSVSAVLCADSQETLSNGQKTERNKIPISLGVAGRFDVVVGGAGIAPLSDVLTTRILEGFDKIRFSTSAGVLPVLRDVVGRFHQSRDYTAFPGTPEDKYVAGLVAVRVIETGECLLLKYFITVVEPVDSYALAGEELASYELIAKRGYRLDLSVDRAVVHGVNVISAGKLSSQYIGGQIRVVQVQSDSVAEADSGRVHKIELHVGEANRLMTELIWQVADQSTEPEDYRSNLRGFCNSMTAARDIYGTKLQPWPDFTLGPFIPPEDDS